MKVAIAGTGPVAQYLVEEFVTYGHEVVVLTRSIKQHLEGKNVIQQVTDYSVDSLIHNLSDCEALVSTINSLFEQAAVARTHLNMLEACQKSDKCKKFIPSEWTANIEEYPEQPMWETGEPTKALYEQLRAQTEIKWTIICVSWFADYVVSRPQRFHPDIGTLWPMNYSTKTFTIYGPGTQLINLVSTRDTARAVAMLFDHAGDWEQYTYVAGDQLSWNDLYGIIERREPQWKCKTKPLAATIRQITANESEESVFAAYFEILSYANASMFRTDKVRRQQAKYFEGMHFRTIEELLDDAAANPERII